MEDAKDWDEATHPLVQTTGERREVKESGGGDDVSAALLVISEECQSAIVLVQMDSYDPTSG